MTGAFGDEARKQALLDDIRQESATYRQWLTHEGVGCDPPPVADQFGLHPAFVRILPILGHFADGKAFYLDALQSIPVGGDTLSAVRRWFLFAWTEPTWGLGRALQETPLHEPAHAIVELVKSSINAPVDKHAWRAARARLNAAQDAASGEKWPVDGVLSMAWDLDQTPGAAWDVVNGWGSDIYFAAYAADEDGLTEEENQIVFQHVGLAHAAALVELGELKRDPDGHAAYLKVTEAYWATEPAGAALRQRQEVQAERAAAKVACWREVAQKAFIALLVTPPPAAGPECSA